MNRVSRHCWAWTLYLAISCVAFPANAQVVQEYEYEPNRIYQVRTGLGITTQIELSPNEKVIDFSTGFSNGWDLTRRDNVFYLKPKNVDVDTNMMIGQGPGCGATHRAQHRADGRRASESATTADDRARATANDDDVAASGRSGRRLDRPSFRRQVEPLPGAEPRRAKERRVMKQWVLVVMATLAFEASAEAGGESQGSYMPVGRSNDPFVFCTEGVREHGWIAVNPMSGTWMPISQYVNYQWIPTYMAICPKALGQGQWEGSGSGATMPFVH